MIVHPFLTDLAEVDNGFGDAKKFADQVGADGMKKLNELTAACVEDVHGNLFSCNPKTSYVADAWVKADP